MECKHIEDLIPGYSLDALEPEEALRVESHLETCPWCSVVVREQREAAAHLALVAEPAHLSGRVFKGLMKRIETLATSGREGSRRPIVTLTTFAYSSAVVALLLLGGVLAFTVRTSSRMDDLKETNEVLSLQVSSLKEDNSLLSQDLKSLGEDNANLSGELAQLREGSDLVAQQMSELNKDSSLVADVAEEVSRLKDGNTAVTAEVTQLSLGSKDLSEQMDYLAQNGREFLDVLRSQRFITYMLTLPGTRVLNLDAAGSEATAQGSLMFNTDSKISVFIATGLKPLSSNQDYYLWLKRKGQTTKLGSMEVDELGWGIVSINPEYDMDEYDWIGLTKEKVEGELPLMARNPVLWGFLVGANPMRP